MAAWNFPVFGHGGDYNPDQWRHIEGTFEEDIRLMKLSHCNIMSVGIFSWASLEPEEGRYDFGWLDEVIEKLYQNGIYTLLATPTGARPTWMSLRYEEVLRVQKDGQRNLHGERHNHCYTSPVYRAFTEKMNTALAERYGKHPGVVGWHISNEYGGECYCPLCVSEFRVWLKAKYGSIEALNQAWWTGFWAKTFNSFDQITAPFEHGESSVHGLSLDWKRFVTARTVDFMTHEIAPLRRITPDLPVTTNMMGTYPGLDYFRFKDIIDVASFDSYPLWGANDGDAEIAVRTAFNHDLTRSILKKPFLLMESTPSMTNWQPVCKPKRPGMHLLSSLHAVAHGADTVQYFQWRKSRGSSEKLHGAVVDHVGHENTRVFREVTEVGQWLAQMTPVVGSETQSPVAVLFDWNNRWAIEAAQGPRRDKQHDQIVLDHYRALTRLGVNIDVIDMEQSFEGYKLIAAPMLYMVKPGVAERLEKFCEQGGTLVLTYWSGIVDENDLCFLGGFPGPLRKLAGVWSEEIDALYDGQVNGMRLEGQNALKLSGEYECGFLLDLCHAETATVEAVYTDDFYAGRPALTRNAFGQGAAWYLAARTGDDFLLDFYRSLFSEAGITPLISALPEGVQVTEREKDGEKFLFVMNFSGAPVDVELPEGREVRTGAAVAGRTSLKVNELIILRR